MIINANALHIPLADRSVQCIVTSPPYWGLRDYGTAKWEGGDPECRHTISRNDADNKAVFADRVNRGDRTVCIKCGAIRIDNQLGLERTPEEYIANMVAVFRECWRVLRDDGTCWVNCGDSYASSPAGSYKTNPGNGGGYRSNKPKMNYDVKPKDLVGIPWRLAFALQADGWYLRSDIIWSKPNPMPESVTDRPTKSHEYLFLLAKQERYFYDQEAIKEDLQESTLERSYAYSDRNYRSEKYDKPGNLISPEMGKKYIPNGRNRRTVWTIPTAPYRGAHFATFPPALVEPCIKAGTSERGACPKCGKGWRRVVEKNYPPEELFTKHNLPNDGLVHAGIRKNGSFKGSGQKVQDWIDEHPAITTGWQPSCTCDAGEHEYNEGLMCNKCQRAKWVIEADNLPCQLPPIPCLVFDPFVGSGTTVKVAYDLGRRGVGLDLSLDYLDEQARKRIHNGHTARLF